MPVRRQFTVMYKSASVRNKIKQTLESDTFILFKPKIALVLDLIATHHINLCIQTDFCTYLGLYMGVCISEHLWNVNRNQCQPFSELELHMLVHTCVHVYTHKKIFKKFPNHPSYFSNMFWLSLLFCCFLLGTFFFIEIQIMLNK